MSTAQIIGGRYYRVLDLGRGGQARVSLAVMAGPQAFRKLVVLKELRTEAAQDPRRRGDFRAEARLAARLNHPNVVQTLEVSEHLGRDFIVMEYLEGQTLEAIWRRCRVPLPLCLSILRDVCGALHYTHELRDYSGRELFPVHRDVSSQNVFVTYTGQVKLVDFGIAQWVRPESEAQHPQLSGKPAYMAPEQAQGAPVDRRADIFSVGILLLEALSGTSPWQGMTEAQILTALRRGIVPSVQLPGTDPALTRIVATAIALHPADRYPTAQHMQSALEDYLRARDSLVTQREMSAFVSSAFDAERTAQGRVVEEKVRGIQLDTQQASPEVAAAPPAPPVSWRAPPVPPPRRVAPPPPPAPRPPPGARLPAPVTRPLSSSLPPPTRAGSGSPDSLPAEGNSTDLRLPPPYEFTDRIDGSRLVFRARNQETERDVAVKLIRSRKEEDPGERFATLARLRHVNTARIWDVGRVEGRPNLGYLVREFVDGKSLAALTEEQGRLRVDRSCALLGEVLLSLSEAHERGLVHGRLHPEHILVSAPGLPRESAKVIGYEGKISKLDPKDAELFQAPGLIWGQRMTPSNDIYAVGALLHWMLFGQPPRWADQALLAPSEDPLGLWTTEAVQVFFQRTLTSDPLSRYQSAADALQALARVDEACLASAPSAEATHPRPMKNRFLAPGASRVFLKMVRNELMSTRSVTIWVLDDDPAVRCPEVQEALTTLDSRYEVRTLGQADRELAIRQLASGEVLPPWIVLFGDLSVLMSDPLLQTLSTCGELSKLLISSHENFELLQHSINQTGLDQHLSLPLEPQDLASAIENLTRRTRRLNNHYDEVRLALRKARDQVGELSRELAASTPPSSASSGTYRAVEVVLANKAK